MAIRSSNRSRSLTIKILKGVDIVLPINDFLDWNKRVEGSSHTCIGRVMSDFDAKAGESNVSLVFLDSNGKPTLDTTVLPIGTVRKYLTANLRHNPKPVPPVLVREEKHAPVLAREKRAPARRQRQRGTIQLHPDDFQHIQGSGRDKKRADPPSTRSRSVQLHVVSAVEVKRSDTEMKGTAVEAPEAERKGPAVEADPAPEMKVPPQDPSKPAPLPQFSPASDAEFKWMGSGASGKDVSAQFATAYESVVRFRKNVFILPGGAVAKRFINRKTDLIEAAATPGPLQRSALKASFCMEHLLLQRVSSRGSSSKTKANAKALARRLELWEQGKIKELLEEAITLQDRLNKDPRSQPLPDAQIARTYGSLVFAGRIGAANRFLSQQAAKKGDVLPANQATLNALRELHPPAVAPDPSLLHPGAPPEVNPVIFEGLDGDAIKRAAQRTQGSHGPSGADAAHYQRILLSFNDTSKRLREALAALARCLCSTAFDPQSLEALLANRLIPLNKDPGVRPIGIGEILRRIIGKAVVHLLRDDILEACGVTQLSGGQPAGIEAIIHAMRELFSSMATDGILLIDAKNAFNTLNRLTALLNIRFICPPISMILINFYRCPARLFCGKAELSSEEGVTQGCPFGMVMYALGTVNFIKAVKVPGTTQAWYADDSQGAGKLQALYDWYIKVRDNGPGYGYYVKPSKSFLVVKPALREAAEKMFNGTGVKIMSGARDLGAGIGDEAFVRKWVADKVKVWTSRVDMITTIAKINPHAAYVGFTRGLQQEWKFVQRTTENTSPLLGEIEEKIRNDFIPALFQKNTPMSDTDRCLYALPARLSGLGIDVPTDPGLDLLANSKRHVEPLSSLIVEGATQLAPDTLSKMASNKKQIKAETQAIHIARADRIREQLSEKAQRHMDCAREKGASAIWTATPDKRLGFTFSRSAFTDMIRLRFGIRLQRLYEICGCGKTNSIDHAQICKTGGFIHGRHDNISRLFARVAKEAGFRDVELEPALTPLTGEAFKLKSTNTADDARADVRIRNYWGSYMQNAFFDTRVFYPFASSMKHLPLKSIYTSQEKTKRREYEQRINRVENGTFTPMVCASTGGMSPLMTTAIGRLASVLALKTNQDYSKVIGFTRIRFAFAMAHSVLTTLRGSRSLTAHVKPIEFPAETALHLVQGPH
jgi:hypothetical protein